MTLSEIVEQLRWCNFQCVAGPLETNKAFQALVEKAQRDEEVQAMLDRLADEEYEDEPHEESLF